jgi:gas vesicle protein
MNKLLSFLGGALIGALAGAVAAMIVAPKPGEATRADIKHEVDMILEEGRKAADAKRKELEAQLGQMRGDGALSKPAAKQG